eukprot:CAMPEP_0117418266 /NCGR_PEP_ID=MMETSP0758-20121206/83_1 /TAXON_ID=63605 /ORGANISM="Percolomonas cosmopolitus, Strain AE-1 (ATCC 50343)" /LENGTH=128 /DNA_ID=CAMNT_0005198669 /DNA_START=609 /DNA_END=991 /DNA_ORIENTATION=-
MNKHQVRASHPKYPNYPIRVDQHYPEVFVRFDWRNPLHHPEKEGVRLADEVLCDEQADWFIDTKEARKTAKKAFHALSNYLKRRDIQLIDICLMITEDGQSIYGEISQDCGRYRSTKESLDKDIWRKG